MAGCKRCALKGEKSEKEKEEKKEKEKRWKKWGSKSSLFFFYVRAHVFSYAQWSFFKYIKKTV